MQSVNNLKEEYTPLHKKILNVRKKQNTSKSKIIEKKNYHLNLLKIDHNTAFSTAGYISHLQWSP